MPSSCHHRRAHGHCPLSYCFTLETDRRSSHVTFDRPKTEPRPAFKTVDVGERGIFWFTLCLRDCRLLPDLPRVLRCVFRAPSTDARRRIAELVEARGESTD